MQFDPKDIDWSRYPKLAAIFEHRPVINVYWQEFFRLLKDIADGSAFLR